MRLTSAKKWIMPQRMSCSGKKIYVTPDILSAIRASIPDLFRLFSHDRSPHRLSERKSENPDTTIKVVATL